MAASEIAALWVAFAATHMGMSSARFRPRLVGALGGRGFQGAYSLVALAIFVPLVSVYFDHKHAGPALWHLGGSPAVRWIAYGVMGLALSLFVGGILRPSPASIITGKPEARGALRITRHPVFMAIGLFGLAHLLVAPVHAAELAFFGGFPVFALLGSRHQDQRKLREGGEEFRRFHADSAWLPFGAPGAVRGLAEMPLAIAIGVALAAILRRYHGALFG